jgi:hypothetical protein
MANSNEKPPAGGSALDRRGFLRAAAGISIGALGLGCEEGEPSAGAVAPAATPARTAARAHQTPPQIQRYVDLGKTGLRISDISFGSGGCKSADLVRYCFDRGINYFDTAEMYRTKGFSQGAYVESLIGEALADKRDRVVITSKFMAEPEHDRHHIMAKLEASLRRLRTDYVDIFLNHAVNSLERLTNPEWFEFVETAKTQGKIRFSGMSGHGGNLQECLEHAIDRDLVDVILASHNFGSDPAFYERFAKHFDLIANQKGIPRLFGKAHAKGIGVIVMKTLMGAKVNDLSAFQYGAATLPQAAFRWVFDDANVDALVISMGDAARVNEFVAVSGQRGVEQADAELLRRYVAGRSDDYCRNGCNRCEQACAFAVPIADVLRQRMYARDYADPELARDGYARLGDGASPCLTCTNPTCVPACPHGLDVAALTRETALRLG